MGTRTRVYVNTALLCVCVHSAWKGHPRNDLGLYCVGRDVKPYSLTLTLK